MPCLPSPRRMVSLSLACVVALSSLGLLAIQPATAAPTTQTPGTTILKTGQLSVEVSTSFPQVLSYTDPATQASMDGSRARLHTITVNGTEYEANGTSTMSSPCRPLATPSSKRAWP